MPVSLENLDDSLQRAAAERYAAREKRIRQAVNSIGRRRVPATESAFRRRAYEARENSLPEITVGLERKLGNSNDMLSSEFLAQGTLAGQAVGLIEIAALNLHGTGFLVAPTVLVTNHHVLPDKQMARRAQFRLGFERDDLPLSPASPKLNLPLDPDRFFIADKDLDFAFIAVDSDNQGSDLPWLPLLAEEGKIIVGHPVNIIQHPDGRVKHVVVHNSHLLDIQNGSPDEMFCWYSSDTDKGSSGSPVFNNRWEVIALHHKAIPKTNKNGEILDINGRTMSKERYREENGNVCWIANEGMRTSRIVERFRQISASTAENQIRDRILSLWQSSLARRPGLKKGWR